MPRVHEVAKELGVSSKEVLARLARMGEPVSSHSSSIDEGVAERLRKDASNGDGPAAAASSSEPVATSPLRRVDPPTGKRTETADTDAGGKSTEAGAAEGETAGAAEGETAGTAEADTAGAGSSAAATGASTSTVAPPAKDGAESSGDAKSSAPTEKKRFGIFKRKEKPVRSRGRRVLGQIAELPLLVFVAFLIAVVIKTFIMQAFYIPSGSMKPTLKIGDRVLVEKVTGWFGGPSHGDVVVFARNVFNGNKGPDLPWYRDAQNYVRELLGLPTGSEEDYIKRIVAVGGDSVRYQRGELYVNDERVQEDYLHENGQPGSSFGAESCPGKMPADEDGCVVPAGHVFVMGDNRDNSADSRSIGPVDEDKIVGRAFVIIWPPADFSGL